MKLIEWKGKTEVELEAQVHANTRFSVPIWEKSTLTLEEAAAFSNIGINKLREITNGENCDFVLWVGNKRLIKRKKLEDFIDKSFSI